MSAISWDSIKLAIQQWVTRGSGLADAQVFWDYQGAASAVRPFITIGVQQIDQPSHDYARKANNPLTFDDVTFTADHTTGELTAAGHGLLSGDGPVQLVTTGTLPGGLALATDYWIIRIDNNTIKLAATYVATGGNYPGNPITPLAFSDNGSGTMQIIDTEDTVRAGQEMVVTALGIRLVTFRLECYGGEKGGSVPMQLLSDVLASLELNIDTLNNAGVGFSTQGVADVEGGIKQLNSRIGGRLEPRAIVDIVGFVNTSLTGYLGRVDQISITPIATLENGDVVSLPTVVIDAT